MEYIGYILYAFFLTIVLYLGIIGFVNSKKHRILYGTIISLFLAFTAYCYIPSTDDLYRHHQDVYSLKYLSNSELLNFFLKTTEKCEALSKIIVSKLGNINLLQFGITFLTYFLIFYLINKITKEKKYSKSSFILTSIFIIASMSYLSIISNLYFTLAIVVFCVGVYKYYKENKYILAFILLALSFFIHSSMIMCIIIFIMFLFFKNKVNIKSTVILAITIFSINIFIPLLHKTFNNNFTADMYNYYISYILDTYNISRLHSRTLMIVYYLKMLPFTLVAFNKKIINTKLDDYTKYVLIFIIIISFLTTFSVRFIPIIQILGYPKIIEFLNNNNIQNKKNKVIYILILLAVIAINIAYQYKQIISLNFR